MARPAASRKWPEQHRPSVAGSKAYSTPALEEPLAASAALAVYTLVVLAADRPALAVYTLAARVTDRPALALAAARAAGRPASVAWVLAVLAARVADRPAPVALAAYTSEMGLDVVSPAASQKAS